MRCVRVLDESVSGLFLWQGIEWTTIEYFNNSIICDLIEKVSARQLSTASGVILDIVSSGFHAKTCKVRRKSVHVAVKEHTLI